MNFSTGQSKSHSERNKRRCFHLPNFGTNHLQSKAVVSQWIDDFGAEFLNAKFSVLEWDKCESAIWIKKQRSGEKSRKFRNYDGKSVNFPFGEQTGNHHLVPPRAIWITIRTYQVIWSELDHSQGFRQCRPCKILLQQAFCSLSRRVRTITLRRMAELCHSIFRANWEMLSLLCHAESKNVQSIGDWETKTCIKMPHNKLWSDKTKHLGQDQRARGTIRTPIHIFLLTTHIVPANRPWLPTCQELFTQTYCWLLHLGGGEWIIGYFTPTTTTPGKVTHFLFAQLGGHSNQPLVWWTAALTIQAWSTTLTNGPHIYKGPFTSG